MAATQHGAIAATRFGLGARPGEILALSRDPRAALASQLNVKASAFPDEGLASTKRHIQAFHESEPGRGASDEERRKARRGYRRQSRRAFGEEVMARTAYAVATPNAFHERWVRFWSNHFTVSARGRNTALVGPFEREAIRPNALKRFSRLLRASSQHPAMLIYLDNHVSFGPGSRAGVRRGRGLNENLAREILELHTLSPEGGYSQDDIVEFAKALTGWTIVNAREAELGWAPFMFRPAINEPGARRVLGKRYNQAGLAQGEAILDDLARHPATAAHIARKLARHFISETPPQDAVDRLATIFMDTNGDLKALALGVLNEPVAWREPGVKVKTPEEFLISALRALDAPLPDGDAMHTSFEALGQLPFTAPSPAGWPDEASAWIGPDGVKKRLEWSHALAARAANADPQRFAADALGPLLSPRTAAALRGAADTVQGLTLALMSPEFQRR